MKKFFVYIAITLLFSNICLAQTGTWSGKLNVSGTELDLVFNLDSGTLDVPDQGARGIPVNVDRSGFGSIGLGIPSINASFEGVWTGKRIAGTFTQHGVQFPLTLNPGEPELRRPQTPVEPFPYRTEEVSFANGDAVLRGTLSIPENCDGATPALLMVTGSGLQNRDEEVFGHKPFAVIADAFARAGIATLRYDDRGFGESTGDVVNCTTRDLADDAEAGVQLLRGRFSRVGVLGHSEGGTIALMLAAEGKADFVVSLAGMVVSGAETLLAQNRHALAAAGLVESNIEAYCRVLSDCLEAVVQGLPLPSGDLLPEGLAQNYRLAAQEFQTPYMRYFLALNVSEELGKVKCPVMALNGTKDIQVDCRTNLDALRKGLGAIAAGASMQSAASGSAQSAAPGAASGSPGAPVEGAAPGAADSGTADSASGTNVIKAEDGLNHLFQHCTTGEVSEYKQIEETFSPAVIDEMIAWIKALP